MNRAGIRRAGRTGPPTFAAAAGLAVAGTAAVLWSGGSPEPVAEDPVATRTTMEWTGPLEVASGDAYQGPWRMNESDFRYVDAPSVALTPGGRVGVVWTDQARKDVLFRAYGSDGEAEGDGPVNVSRSPDVFSWLPRIRFAPDDPDLVHALWQEIIFSGGSHGGEILYSRSSDGGRSFQEPINLSRTPAGAGKGRLSRNIWDNGSLALEVAPGGAVVVAWTEYEGALRVVRSEDGGRAFQDPVTVVPEGGAEPARAPALAMDPEGRVHLAWTVGEDPAADLRFALSEDGGRSFDEPRTLFRSGGHADAPSLAVGPDGVVHLAYMEAEAGPFERPEVRYGRWSGAGEPDFGMPVGISGVGRAGTAGSGSEGAEAPGAGFPAIAVDEAGGVWVLWDRFPVPGERPRGLALARSTDMGGTFGAPEAVPGTGDPELGFSGSLQGLLQEKLAVGSDGRVAVVNGTFNPGQRSRIRLLLGRAPE